MMDTAGEPLVSVVVPAWNAEATLAASLKSVAMQSYRNLEILVVNDGSTDRTGDVARSFCEGDHRARMLEQNNQGVAAARNSAIEVARGEWIAPLDADDLWHPLKIERQMDVARSSAERPGFVYCWHRLIDAESRVSGSGPSWKLDGQAYHQLGYLNAVENGSALLLSRQAVKQVGGYDPSLRAQDAQGCEDVLLQLLIAAHFPIGCVPQYLVGHRRHGANMSSGFDRMVRSWKLAYWRAGQERPLPPEVIRWVDGKCAFDIAEHRAASGDIAGGVSMLKRALTHDFARSSRILAYRLARSARRRFRSEPPPNCRPNFFELDPEQAFEGDVHAWPSLKALVTSLDARRLDRLSQPAQQEA